VPTLEQLPGPVDLVSVAVPTADHRKIAEPLLLRGVSCLVEKPLAGSTRDAQALVEAAARGGALLQVGLVERFNPVLDALSRLGGPPAFLEVHRLAPYSFRASDTGVVMDMMIHDLDILNHLVGEEPERVDAVGVPVVSQHEDIVNARLTYPSGAVANVTASRVSLQRMRRIRIFSREAYLSLDYDRREALLVRRSARLDEWTAGARLPATQPPAFQDLLVTEKLPIHDGEPLKEELVAAVEAVRSGSPPRVSGDEALKALRVAERILSDLRTHRTRSDLVTRPGPVS
jgi:predicted dehydrogenase